MTDGVYSFTVKSTPFSKLELLCNLAHELAHTAHWLHSPDHKKLECDIIKIFMDELNMIGYESEENENIKSRRIL